MTKVILVAFTAIDESALGLIGYQTHNNPYLPYREACADELAEAAGRLCYLSFDRPNPQTAENDTYLANILALGHESVLEHASATFYIETSRSVLTELERHRHLSFSVVSQRYVDANDLGALLPPALSEIEGNPFGILEHFTAAFDKYDEIVDGLTARGLPRKKAREAARCVLPNMTTSPMLVTGNIRAWRDVLKKRYHVAADAEIREVATEILSILRTVVAPNSFQDFPKEPFS